MADFTGAITGLNKTINTLTNLDQGLRNTLSANNINLASQTKSGKLSDRKLIIWQIQGLPEKMQIADLMMSINPRNLNSNYTQLINRKRTHGGFIEEHWGEQLDTLSASGTTRQFLGDKGLTNFGRRDTFGFKEYEQLLTYYRNNGSIYDDKSGQVVAQGTIVMNYDSMIFNGYFENLTVVESAEKPFCLEYDFTFKVTIEVFPGRIQSFVNVTTVPTVGAIQNDRVSIDITTTAGGTTATTGTV